MILLTTRNTTATERRVGLMRALIAEFGARDMATDEVCAFLGFSPSGTRKYLQDLRAAFLVEVAHHVERHNSHVPMPIYRLTADKDRVTHFLQLLAAPGHKKSMAGRPSNLSLAQRAPGRHLHILEDDQVLPLRLHKDGPIIHEPVLAAFFGLSRGAA